MNNFINILFFILVILISLTLHELGHFIFAKIFKITVYEFSIGIGPRIFSFKKNKTVYSFRAFPVMAYVSLATKKLNNLYNEIFDELKQDKRYDEKIIDMKFNDQFKLVFYNKFSIDNFKKVLYIRECTKYSNLVNISLDSVYIEKISIWKNFLIIFGGVLANIILFSIGIAIFFSLNNEINILNLFDNFFIELGNILIFKKNIPNAEITPTRDTLFIFYLTMINLSLFLINILPIPPLDGFRFLSYLFEKINKKNIPESIDLFFAIIGIIFIVYLSIASIANGFLPG